MTTRTMIGGGLAWVLLASVPVGAQEVTAPQGQLRIGNMPTVYVVDAAGAETKGRLIGLDASSITVRGGDGADHRFDRHDLVRITRRGNCAKGGAIVGGAIGAGIGLLAAGFADHAGQAVGLALMSAGFYAAVGAGIGVLVPRRVPIYETWPAPGASSAGKSAAARIGGRLGFTCSLSW